MDFESLSKDFEEARKMNAVDCEEYICKGFLAHDFIIEWTMEKIQASIRKFNPPYRVNPDGTVEVMSCPCNCCKSEKDD